MSEAGNYNYLMESFCLLCVQAHVHLHTNTCTHMHKQPHTYVYIQTSHSRPTSLFTLV